MLEIPMRPAHRRQRKIVLRHVASVGLNRRDPPVQPPDHLVVEAFGHIRFAQIRLLANEPEQATEDGNKP